MCNSNGAFCLKFARVMLIIFNALFTLCGILLMAVGIWLLVDPSVVNVVTPLNSLDAKNSSLLRNSAIILLSTGCALFLICFLGFFGAVMNWRIVLGIYIGLLVVVFCCEVAGAVVSIAYKDWFMDNLDDSLLASITKNDPPYYVHSTAGQCKTSTFGGLWDYIQVQFNCCGIHQDPHSGYEMLTYSLRDACPGTPGISSRPLSCCVQIQNAPKPNFDDGLQAKALSSFDCSSIKKQGCYDKIVWWVGYYSPVLIGVGFGVAFLQIIGFIFAVCVCVNASRHHHGYKRR